jgi:endoglucanase
MAALRILVMLSLYIMTATVGHAADAPALQHGLNLSSWLANAPRQPLYARDFAHIKQAGFDHVRLPFNPAYYGFALSPNGGAAARVDFIGLDRTVSMAEQYQLPVIIDIHPDGAFMDTLERHVWAEKDFIDLWKTIAERYKNHGSGQVIFELLNEPQYYKSEGLWNKLAARTVAAIRAISPDRIIIIGAPHGSEIDALPFLQTGNDSHIIYAFHFYEPYLITHQGIHMGFEEKMIRYFRKLPYPSSLATGNAKEYAPTAPDAEKAQNELQEYKATPWDAEHVATRIHAAQQWATQHHVRILCGEFGVLRNHIDPDSRYRWIRDARSAMDTDGIGWELWDYTDLFGIAPPVEPSSPDPVDGSVRMSDSENGSRQFEPQALSALGLRTAAQ